MSALCGERPAASQVSLEDRKMKMMQQRRLHLDKQRTGAGAHFMRGMAQANTHAPMQYTKTLECSVVFRAEPRAENEGTTEKKKDDLQEAQDKTPAAGLDLNIAPTSVLSDNISEATCNIALGEQAQRSQTPVSVLEPKSFLHGEEIVPASISTGEVQPFGNEAAAKEKNGSRWWKPTFGLRGRSNSRAALEQAAPKSNVGPQNDDIIEVFGSERPESSSSARRNFHTASRDVPVAAVQQPDSSKATEVIDTISCQSTPKAGSAPSAPSRNSGYPLAATPSRFDASPSPVSCALEAFDNVSVDAVEGLPGCPA